MAIWAFFIFGALVYIGIAVEKVAAAIRESKNRSQFKEGQDG